MWTTAYGVPGAVTHVEQPDAATDGAAGAPRAITGVTGGWPQPRLRQCHTR